MSTDLSPARRQTDVSPSLQYSCTVVYERFDDVASQVFKFKGALLKIPSKGSFVHLFVIDRDPTGSPDVSRTDVI